MSIKFESKGQVTLFTKILLAIVASACFGLVLAAIWSYHSEMKLFRVESELASHANHVGKILMGNYLAYEKDGVVYAGLLDVKKIEDYETYGHEPCARNYYYGWKAVINDSETENIFFLGSNSSVGLAVDGQSFVSFPVALKYDGRVNHGKLTVTVTNGDLERIAGLIDRVCKEAEVGKSDREAIYVDYKMNITKDLCLLLNKEKVCRKLECELPVEETVLYPETNYVLEAKYEEAKKEREGLVHHEIQINAKII